MTNEEAKAKLDEMVATIQAGIDHLTAFAYEHQLPFELKVSSTYYETKYTAHVERGRSGNMDAWVSSTYEYPDWESSDC